MPMRDELIQRAIQQLAITFARLLSRQGNVGHVETQTLRAEMEALYPAFLGTSAALLRRLGTEDILGVLRTAGYVDGERAYLLGALFEAEAELLLAERELGPGLELGPGHEDGYEDDTTAHSHVLDQVTSLRLRALDLVLEAGIEELGEPDIPDRVERLRAAVASQPRTAASWERLHRFLAGRGSYAKAEDALFAWMGTVADAGHRPGDREWRDATETGDSFYRSLAELDDAALEAGGLPRDEVDEGRSAFAERLAELTAP